jgi:signal transduction histidine kinase
MMFRRARLRLTLLYIGLFALVLIVFSVVFYLAFVTVLEPAFDIAPELSNTQAAEVAYQATIARIAVALAVADLAAVAVVGGVAWILATRTLTPIREAHQRQQRFVADASHEMRNPLAAIKSTAQAALAGRGSAAQMRTALTAVVDATDRLTRLTNDLLSLARSDGALVEHRVERCDLSVVVAETVEQYGVIDSRRRAVRATFAADLPIEADPDEVGRIVRNLLDNAFRHGGPGVHVTVTTRAGDREVILQVADDGPGIAAADIDQIFEPFYRVGTHPDSDGSGLGLAIAADLAARNGGRLTVTSIPGSGSAFRLVLPRLR